MLAAFDNLIYMQATCKHVSNIITTLNYISIMLNHVNLLTKCVCNKHASNMLNQTTNTQNQSALHMCWKVKPKHLNRHLLASCSVGNKPCPHHISEWDINQTIKITLIIFVSKDDVHYFRSFLITVRILRLQTNNCFTDSGSKSITPAQIQAPNESLLCRIRLQI